MSLIFTEQILLGMYSDVVQRAIVYLNQLILKQGFLFSFFFCSWHDRAAKTFCFLTLACQRFVITGDSIFALSLPAWIFRGWERLLTFRAGLYGEDNFILLSRCPENCLFMQLGVVLPKYPQKLCLMLCTPFPALSWWGGWASCLFLSTYIHAISLQSFLVTVSGVWNSWHHPPLGTGSGTLCAHADGIRHSRESHWGQDKVEREDRFLASQELWPVSV